MAQTVNVPGVGQLSFPDGMSQPDMAAAIQKNYPQIHNTQVPQTAAPVQAATQPGAQQPYQPIKPAGEYGGMAVGPFGAGTMPNMYSSGQLQAAQQGVNVDTPAPVSTTRANFAATQDQRDQIVSNQIKAKYGPNTPTRQGADGLEWYNTKADGGRGQWQTVGNSVGGDLVNAIPATTEAVGAGVGSLGGWEVLGGAAGAGIGRAAGQGIKNLVGNALYPDTPTSQYPSLVKAGLMSAGTTLAGGALLSGLPAVLRMSFRGADVAPSARAIQSILQSYDKNVGMVTEMNQALEAQGKQPLKMSIPRVAMITQSPSDVANPDAVNMADEEPILSAGWRNSNQSALNSANRHGVEDFWQNEINNPYAYSNINQQNWQQRLGQIFQNFKDRMLGPAQQDADNAVQAAQQAAQQQKQPGQLSLASMGQTVRQAILKHYQNSKDQVDQAWAAYETAAKYKPNGVTSSIRVPMTADMMQTQRAFGQLSEGSLLPSARAQGARYLIDMQPGVNFADQTVDLARLDRTIKDLRLESRRAAAGTVSDDMSDANRNRLLSSLTGMRQDFMQQPGNEELNAALTGAEAETVRHTNEFQRGFVGDFLTRDDNKNFTISDPTLLHNLLSSGAGGTPDVEGARQLATLVNGDPAAHAAILDYAHAFYNVRYTAMKNGVRSLSPNGHAKFVEQVMPTLDPFLNPAERAGFRKLGGLAQGLVKTKSALADAEDAWNNSDPGRLGASLKNETFVGQFFNRRNSFADQNLGFIKNRLDGIGTGNSDALDLARSGIVQELNDRARFNGTLDPNRLFNLYNPLKNRFQAYFGKGFTDAMDKIIPVYRAMTQPTKTVAQYEGTTKLSHYVRYAVLGPLSPENRKLTILENWRTKSYANRLEQAMYDPNALKQLASDMGKWGFRANRARVGVAAGTGYDMSTHGSSIPQQKQQGQGTNTSVYP
ncbi:MAG: hypothetical protein KGL39_08900 [Patescibacteria group bacterium]|nr:hypothetical protein [Patescibacteria group bacterium]